MHSTFSLWVAGMFLVLGAACGGDDDPEACPVLPPCITGSTWNATTCACVLDDELPDATDGSKAAPPIGVDGRFEAEEAFEPDGGHESSDTADDASD